MLNLGRYLQYKPNQTFRQMTWNKLWNYSREYLGCVLLHLIASVKFSFLILFITILDLTFYKELGYLLWVILINLISCNTSESTKKTSLTSLLQSRAVKIEERENDPELLMCTQIFGFQVDKWLGSDRIFTLCWCLFSSLAFVCLCFSLFGTVLRDNCRSVFEEKFDLVQLATTSNQFFQQQN
jgi:hypothetical protein